MWLSFIASRVRGYGSLFQWNTKEASPSRIIAMQCSFALKQYVWRRCWELRFPEVHCTTEKLIEGGMSNSTRSYGMRQRK